MAARGEGWGGEKVRHLVSEGLISVMDELSSKQARKEGVSEHLNAFFYYLIHSPIQHTQQN